MSIRERLSVVGCVKPDKPILLFAGSPWGLDQEDKFCQEYQTPEGRKHTSELGAFIMEDTQSVGGFTGKVRTCQSVGCRWHERNPRRLNGAKFVQDFPIGTHVQHVSQFNRNHSAPHGLTAPGDVYEDLTSSYVTIVKVNGREQSTERWLIDSVKKFVHRDVLD